MLRESLTGDKLRVRNFDQPSPADRAYMAIEKTNEAPWRNPWRKIGALTNVSGPSAVLVRFEDPVDLMDSERAAFVWDGEILAAGPYDIREGSSVIFEIPEVSGDILELWCTDNLPVSFAVEPLAKVAELRKEAAKDTDGPGIVDRYFSTIKTMGFFGTVLAGVAVYILAPHVASMIKAAK